MRLSTPIFRLKRQARLLARKQAIPLHQALDEIAQGEGYRRWSHLASAADGPSPAETVFAALQPGDMLLLAARPGHGKTMMGLEIAAMAHRRRMKGLFFTLDYNETDVKDQLGADVIIDTSDEICADYIIERQKGLSGPSVAVIDYLQLLDQRRSTPDLNDQIAALHAHARQSGQIIVAISQIERAFELSGKPTPDLSDIRLPNPADLGLFTKHCFLHDGVAEFSH